MISHTRMSISTIGATVASTGLAVATIGLVAPADAAASVDYTCSTAIGNQTFTAVNDSNAPATMFVGQSKPITLTSTVTIPASLTGALYGLGGRTADGTATAHGTIGGKSTTSKLTVPTTTIPSDEALTVVARGKGGTYKATKPGKVALKAGDFTSVLNVYDADGKPLSGLVTSPVTVPCTAPTTGTTFDTITVKKDTTKTKAAAADVKKGKKATVKVTVKPAHGTTPTGKVKVLVLKGKKTIEKKTVALKKGKATVTLPKKLKKKGTYTATAKYAGSSTLVKSSGTHTFKVK